jgi:hypothetical protein
MHHHPIAALLPLLLCAAPPAQQQLAVSPADRAGLEGSSFTHFPLGRANARMQTLHADVPGGMLISGHAYRRDADGVRGTIAGFSSDLQVTLSMSQRQPTQASTQFALNAGPSPVVALPRTVLAFSSTNRPALDPAPVFELVIPYQVPFLVPAQGGTLCVDVEVFGNQTASGTDQNVSIYLDAHELTTDGHVEQPGFRTGTGCAAPGATSDCFASMTFWRLPMDSTLDVSIRTGVADTGSNTTLPLLTIGLSPIGQPISFRPDCTFWSSAEIGYVLPGAMDAQGRYDGAVTGIPHLPAGMRLWCQAGSVDLANGDLAASDATTFVTPPPGPLPIPVCRIVNSTNQQAATGTVSYAVPVMAFF